MYHQACKCQTVRSLEFDWRLVQLCTILQLVVGPFKVNYLSCVYRTPQRYCTGGPRLYPPCVHPVKSQKQFSWMIANLALLKYLLLHISNLEKQIMLLNCYSIAYGRTIGIGNDPSAKPNFWRRKSILGVRSLALLSIWWFLFGQYHVHSHCVL